MELAFGIELSVEEGKKPGFYAQLIKEMAGKVNIQDRDGALYIVKTKEEAETLKSLYINKKAFEEEYELILLNAPELTDAWNDYGFASDTEKLYLYKDMIASYSFSGGLKENREMALLQMEEHLIGRETGESAIYFVDRSHIELIRGIARAYNVEVSFFDLDKISEND